MHQGFLINFIKKLNFVFFLKSTSSDSDSDPEGGELPDIPYQKEEQEQIQKKKLKKKRFEKIAEERIQKLPRKREVRSKKPKKRLFVFFLLK